MSKKSLLHLSEEAWNDLEKVREGIDLEADVNEHSLDGGHTPLMCAVKNSRSTGVIELLVRRGADLNARDSDGKTPLMHAAENNRNPDIVELLINYGANPNERTGEYNWAEGFGNYLVGNGLTPLMYAAKSNPNPNVLSRLIRLGACVNARSDEQYEYGWTPLMFAVESNQDPVFIEIFAKYGADLNARENSQVAGAALHLANVDSAKMLLKLGADVDVTDCRGWTPLMYAAESGQHELAELLLEAGADVNNDCGPLCGAASSAIVELLVKAGADVNAKFGYNEKTPLMYATNPDVAEALINNGADLNICDREGLTALAHAFLRDQNQNLIEQLIISGADISPDVVNAIKKKKERKRLEAEEKKLEAEDAKRGAEEWEKRKRK